MDLGSKEDKEQEGITEEVTQITVNADQAVILYRAMISLSVELKVRKEGLKTQRADVRNVGPGKAMPTEEINKITEELNVINYTEDKIPYLVDSIKEAIVYLQKEDDALIKGIQL